MSEEPALLSSPRPNLPYRLMSWLLVLPLYRLVFRGRTEGRDQVPVEGALVVIANHGSHLDPPLLAHALGRPVAFMAKAELFRVPLFGRLIRACGAYPVSRGTGDRAAIRTASERLRRGWAIGLFLDGTRRADGRVHAPQLGAALLAARCGVPLLPVAIINSHRALGPQGGGLRLVPVHVRIGTPIPPPASPGRDELERVTGAAQEQINALLDQGLIQAPRLAGARNRAALPPNS